MRTLVVSSSLVAALLVLLVPSSHGTGLSYTLSLQTPKFESLQTSLSPTGGNVSVALEVKYDLAGAASFAGTVDGFSVTGKPTLKTGPAGTTYKFALRAATLPPTVVSIS